MVKFALKPNGSSSWSLPWFELHEAARSVVCINWSSHLEVMSSRGWVMLPKIFVILPKNFGHLAQNFGHVAQNFSHVVQNFSHVIQNL